jgi:hypothetical protein
MEEFIKNLKAVRDEYLKNKVIINTNGIYPTRTDNLEPFTDADIESTAQLMYNASRTIPWLVQKGKGKGGVNSYNLKQMIQQSTQIYLTNGELILVMLTMGYEISKLRNTRMNCNFKCSYAKSDAMNAISLPTPTTATP